MLSPVDRLVERRTAATAEAAAMGAWVATGSLRQDLRDHQSLLEAQPLGVQSAIRAQARELGAILVEQNHRSGASFRLPDQVLVFESSSREGRLTSVPVECRVQRVGHLLGRVRAIDIRAAVCLRLAGLCRSPDSAVAVGASLLRYATAWHLVHERTPVDDGQPPITKEGLNPDSLQARLAEAQHNCQVLDLALEIAPFMAADDELQCRRRASQARLIASGQAFAESQLQEIVAIIRRRAQAGDLNRGLRVSLPYLDDQVLAIKRWEIEVIPPGRIMFSPILVWEAARWEQSRVARTAGMSYWTRTHLLDELDKLGQVFRSDFMKASRN